MRKMPAVIAGIFSKNGEMYEKIKYYFDRYQESSEAEDKNCCDRHIFGCTCSLSFCQYNSGGKYAAKCGKNGESNGRRYYRSAGRV